MKKVLISSQNPVKIEAARGAFKKMFSQEKFEFEAYKISSGLGNQPIGDQETLQGALNRVNKVAKIAPADFYLGIEGGVEFRGEDLAAFAWVVVKSGNKYGKSRTETFFLPKKVIELITEGKELGVANDIIFKTKNSKQKNGALGLLTGNISSRTKYYLEAVILALIPFKNPDLY